MFASPCSGTLQPFRRAWCFVLMSSCPFWLSKVRDAPTPFLILAASQKIHVRTFPLGEMPRRMCHLKAIGSFGLITTKFENTDPSTGEWSFIRLLDERTFEPLDSFRLQRFESGCSLSPVGVSTDLDRPTLFVVGTAFSLPGEEEPTRGRILLFNVRIPLPQLFTSARQWEGSFNSLTRRWYLARSSLSNPIATPNFSPR